MPGWEKLLYSLLALAAYGLLCCYCYGRPRRATPNAGLGDDKVIVAYASQSGNALRLAEQTCGALARGGNPLPLNHVNDDLLSSARRALFVVSTYGEGEAPDNGLRFERQLLKQVGGRDLSHLEYAVLALGDSGYPNYCAFGRRLDNSLSNLGARALFERVEVDTRQDPELTAAQRWLRQAGANAPEFDLPAPATQPFAPWTLLERQWLNPDSDSPPLLRLGFACPPRGNLNWQPGDIAELMPRNAQARCEEFLCALAPGLATEEAEDLLVELLQYRQLPPVENLAALARDGLRQWIEALPPLAKREYSIASLPTDGRLDLLLRVRRDERGQMGASSEWLSQGLQPGQEQQLRIRANPLFNLPDTSSPLILIGSGSGLAGLWGHLKARRQAERRQNWLLFGERDPVRDRIFAAEIAALKAEGYLPELDLVFSRCASHPSYIQDRLLERGSDVERWVNDGATILVCGSRGGMARGVDQALRKILGSETVNGLADEGRYRRDVY